MKTPTTNVLSRLVVGRRRRFVVVGVWLLAGRFEQSRANEPSTLLPGGAESVKVPEAANGFPSGERTPAVAVDAFVVRSVPVPALTFELGERVWWPSNLIRRRHETAARSQVAPPAEPVVHGRAE